MIAGLIFSWKQKHEKCGANADDGLIGAKSDNSAVLSGILGDTEQWLFVIFSAILRGMTLLFSAYELSVWSPSVYKGWVLVIQIKKTDYNSWTEWPHGFLWTVESIHIRKTVNLLCIQVNRTEGAQTLFS